MPRYVGVAVLAAAAGLVVMLGWEGTQYILHPELRPSAAQSSAAGPGTHSPAPWETEILSSLDAGVQDAGAGKLMAAEMDVDRAGSVATTMRIESRTAAPTFFALSLDALDRVLAKHPDDERMMDHVTQARVALAELRSSMNVAPNGPPDATMNATTNGGAAPSAPPAPDAVQASPASVVAPDATRVSLGAPRELPADSVLDPATLRAKYLDATLMPDTLEILLPPASRSFADGVRVENLTISGAAQTLDGIRWRNVTFVGTHLRYESGALDLENVHFVNCRFGFPSDDRGARLANALALGRSSITIQ
jgi:hypothetical protein